MNSKGNVCVFLFRCEAFRDRQAVTNCYAHCNMSTARKRSMIGKGIFNIFFKYTILLVLLTRKLRRSLPSLIVFSDIVELCFLSLPYSVTLCKEELMIGWMLSRFYGRQIAGWMEGELHCACQIFGFFFRSVTCGFDFFVQHSNWHF